MPTSTAMAMAQWDAGQVLPSLWVGSLSAAEDENELRNHGITHILTAASRLRLSWRDKDGTTQHHEEEVTAASERKTPPLIADKNILTLEVDDHPAESLLLFFEECCTFIDSAISNPDPGDGVGGGVLVHCASGISRSVAVCCAYLMLREKISYEDALTRIRKKRNMANPNFGFQRQLHCLEKCDYILQKALELYAKLEQDESSTDTVRKTREQANNFHAEVDRVEEEIMATKTENILRKQDKYILDISLLQNRIDNYMTDLVRHSIGDKVSKNDFEISIKKGKQIVEEVIFT